MVATTIAAQAVFRLKSKVDRRKKEEEEAEERRRLAEADKHPAVVVEVPEDYLREECEKDDKGRKEREAKLLLRARSKIVFYFPKVLDCERRLRTRLSTSPPLKVLMNGLLLPTDYRVMLHAARDRQRADEDEERRRREAARQQLQSRQKFGAGGGGGGTRKGVD